MATAAEKLLERMRQSKQGWTFDDLEHLYIGFGFSYRDKGKHRVYTHPAHKGLIATVTYHRKLPVGYIQTALKLVGESIKLDKIKAERPSGRR